MALRWRVKLSDGTNEIVKETTKVEWPLQTDGFVKIHFSASQFTLDEFELLDSWESNQTELTVEINAYCEELPPVFDSPIKCDEEIADYNSQSGTAKIVDPTDCAEINGEVVCKGWVYDPNGEVIIPLMFGEWE